VKQFILITIATLLFATPAWAQKDTTYLVQLDAGQNKNLKVELPEGSSEIQIGSSDVGAIYTAKLYDANGDLVTTCDQVANNHTTLCVIRVAKLALPIKIKMDITNQTNHLLNVNVWVHPTK
jgi:hypothetical protein